MSLSQLVHFDRLLLTWKRLSRTSKALFIILALAFACSIVLSYSLSPAPRPVIDLPLSYHYIPGRLPQSAAELYSTPLNILPSLRPGRTKCVSDFLEPPDSCSGACPFIALTRQKCEFLPRKIDENLLALGFYCEIQSIAPDNCPEYNAFLKDELPAVTEAIREIPSDLIDRFTLGGRIPLIDYFIFRGESIGNTEETVWSREFIDQFRSQVKARQPLGTYDTAELYPVLDKYSARTIQNRHCIVIGSEFPWIEASLLEYGAQQVLTIEYGKIRSEVPELKTIQPREYANQRANAHSKGESYELADSIWIYSSIEHDGLARYGDPLNPDGDFQTMTKLSCMLKPGAFLFVAIPTREIDQLYWNAHRMYGPLRIPLLFRHFHLVEIIGSPSKPSTRPGSSQPVFVLQNKIGCE
jgi:hypothetical protein